MVIYRYKQKQNIHYENLKELKIIHDNALLQSQLEMQEQTFQNISREIHDNIGQKLTLVKVYLNTISLADTNNASQRISDSVSMISKAISDLSDISRSLSSEIIVNYGLIKALEFETSQLEKTGVYNIFLSITGDTVFLDAHKDLILFRIVQEALNNIVKHAQATKINIHLHYTHQLLMLDIQDNGKGFVSNQYTIKSTGLINMTKRTHMLNGKIAINSQPGHGTAIKIEIPIYDNKKNI